MRRVSKPRTLSRSATGPPVSEWRRFREKISHATIQAWTLEPMGATHAFAHAALEAGATIKTGARCAQISTRNGRVQGVLTDQGIIAADLVFIANGLDLRFRGTTHIRRPP
jgi:glycine/D-amino acid oxidase-like deaminating enzyme